jgi:hypothetical protein
MISLHQFADYVVYTSTGCSVLYSVLPTSETFAAYPRFQKGYTLFLSILKQLGANLRNVVFPQISTAHGTQVSVAAQQNPVTPA